MKLLSDQTASWLELGNYSQVQANSRLKVHFSENLVNSGSLHPHLGKKGFALQIHELNGDSWGLRGVEPCVGTSQRIFEGLISAWVQVQGLGEDEHGEAAAGVGRAQRVSHLLLPWICDVPILKCCLAQRWCNSCAPVAFIKTADTYFTSKGHQKFTRHFYEWKHQ
jgi:hypothetical protein